MFSQACVKNSVHRGGGFCLWVWGQGGCLPLGPAGMYILLRQKRPRQTPSLQADTMPLQQTDHPSPRDGHCSRRYASYWNVFLFYLDLHEILGMNFSKIGSWPSTSSLSNPGSGTTCFTITATIELYSTMAILSV